MGPVLTSKMSSTDKMDVLLLKGHIYYYVHYYAIMQDYAYPELNKAQQSKHVLKCFIIANEVLLAAAKLVGR